MQSNLGDAPFNPYVMASEMEIEHRGFKLVRNPQHVLWEIKSDKRLPRYLVGWYTNIAIAKERIDEYLKEKDNNGKH